MVVFHPITWACFRIACCKKKRENNIQNPQASSFSVFSSSSWWGSIWSPKSVQNTKPLLLEGLAKNWHLKWKTFPKDWVCYILVHAPFGNKHHKNHVETEFHHVFPAPFRVMIKKTQTNPSGRHEHRKTWRNPTWNSLNFESFGIFTVLDVDSLAFIILTTNQPTNRQPNAAPTKGGLVWTFRHCDGVLFFSRRTQDIWSGSACAQKPAPCSNSGTWKHEKKKRGRWQKKSTRWFKVTFLGWLSDLLERLSDLQLGDKRVTNINGKNEAD